MARAYALLDSEQPDRRVWRGGREGGNVFCPRILHSLASLVASCRPRCLVATLVCPQPHELTDGNVRLVREHLLRVTDLEIDLGVSKQSLRLAPAQESCREDVEQGRLPTRQRKLVVPAKARVLGFKYHEVGSSEEAAPCHLLHL